MKKYKAIFFDWDGTAVVKRESPADNVAGAMARLLEQGVYLFVISGTTYKNISNGRLHEFFTPKQREYLYFGLGRGTYNFYINENGSLVDITNPDIGKELLLKIHDVAYQVHRHMYERYTYPTDIVFDRPNYCKIDIMNQNSRQDNLYLSGNEIVNVKKTLENAGYFGGLKGLIELAGDIGRDNGINIKATCDAKFLEVGVLNKSDNVDAFLNLVLMPKEITSSECSFWGDEYLELDDGIWGSDSFMLTELSKDGDFYDVGTVSGRRPNDVKHIGGSVDAFIDFLEQQARIPLD